MVGLSRSPEKLGKHERYTPRSIDINTASIEKFAKALDDCEIVVSEYGPHTAGHEALQYSKGLKIERPGEILLTDQVPYLETVRKIILAVKLAEVKYFVMVGGAGSLHVPGDPYGDCLVDNKHFFLAYRRDLSDSHAHVTYMEERLGPMGSNLRKYRNARAALREDKATPDQLAFIEEYEGKTREKDPALEFIKAGRTSYMFFEGNNSFRWTYVSPSPLYRPDARTGKYRVVVDDVPLKDCPAASENPLDGRLTGISVADLSIAIADEIEKQQYAGKHWTAVGELLDVPGPSYLTLDSVGKPQ